MKHEPIGETVRHSRNTCHFHWFWSIGGAIEQAMTMHRLALGGV
jgi:hypothetical protein